MRILHVTQNYYPFLERGGPTVKVRAIAEGLQRRGHSNTVLTSWYGSKPNPRRTNMHGVQVVYLRRLLNYRALTLNSGLFAFCRRELPNFDVVHLYGIYDLLGPVVAHSAFGRNIPYLLEPLGMSRPIDRSFRIKRMWHSIFGKRLFENASFVITTSRQEERELLDGWPQARIALRYNGIDLNEYAGLPARGGFRAQWGIPTEEPVLLFLGRIIPRKGVDMLIAALAELPAERAWLVVAGPEGEPNYVQEMRKLAEAKGVAARVIFAGPLYGEQKKAALVDCDLFLLPSRYENFANSVAEAVACHRPVIISDQCGISEFVADKVGLVIPREQATLTGAIRRLLNDRALYDRFQSACSGVAARLGWPEMLNEQEALYERARSAVRKPR